MGILSSLLGRRFKKIYRARVGLFDLGEEESPVEAQPIAIHAVWPALMGVPTEPATAEETTFTATTVMDGLRTLLAVPAIGLLTSTYFRWTPYRTYQGNKVFRDPVDEVLAGDAQIDRKKVYGTFDNRLLGPRAIRLEQIKRISLDRFKPDSAALTVHLSRRPVKWWNLGAGPSF